MGQTILLNNLLSIEKITATNKVMLTDKQLTYYRTIGDLSADTLIEQLVAQEGISFLRSLMPFLADFKKLDFSGQPQLLQGFLRQNSTYPDLFNKKELIRATDFYRQNQQTIGLILGLYALPYCYLGADGARVLYLSERIRKDTYNRLIETGSFLKAVMNYDNWTSQRIFAICTKVRLMHAAIRYFTLHSQQWDMAWGYPINQEDMLGTNLAFSLVVLKGMRKLGYSIDNAYQRAYLHTWNAIGFLLGVDKAILLANEQDAIGVERLIAARQFRQSAESQALTDSLMKAIRNISPNELTANLLQAQSRFLLGEKYAEMLGVKETNIPANLLKVYNLTSVVLARFF
ncbi:oxygenase MpaB family protein [Emticicia soli]|uniref:Oxygenase MpaB family protein n=1 Tax=Emticicia soli TaxID=2027878 RepID=A0ABW5JDC4_9BACT